MVKSVGKVRSETPSKMIVLDFSDAGHPTVSYTGASWTGRDVRIALTLVQKGYTKQRYNLAHIKEEK